MKKAEKAVYCSSDGTKKGPRILRAEELRGIVGGETMEEYLARRDTQENAWDAESMMQGAVSGGFWGGVKVL